MTEPLRVVIQMNDQGRMTVYADPGVSIICLDDNTPSDRLYRMTPGPIPDGMLAGPIGYAGDDSPADTRAHHAAAFISERSHLTVVEKETDE